MRHALRATIKKWGNSLGLRIPKALADQIGIREDSEVAISIEDGQLVVRPVRTSRYELAELLRGITKDTIHDEVATDGPVGREHW